MKIESGGNYSARGPLTAKGNHAYGAYQVMDFNIPRWTEAYCGKEYSIKEFVADHECQDIVAGRVATNNLRDYGTEEDAIALWFSGRPFTGNTRCDVNMCVPAYVAAAIKSLKN